MSTSERKRVVEEHQAKVALYDRLQAKGVKDKPRHAMVHKRISTHMKQALHAADDAGKTLITIIIYNIIPFTHMKQALHAADDAGKTLITIIIYNITPFTHMKQPI